MNSSTPAVNQMILLANLTAGSVLRKFDDERNVCRRRHAVADPKSQPPLFTDVTTFGARAQARARRLPQGRAVALAGRLVDRGCDGHRSRGYRQDRRTPSFRRAWSGGLEALR